MVARNYSKDVDKALCRLFWLALLCSVLMLAGLGALILVLIKYWEIVVRALIAGVAVGVGFVLAARVVGWWVFRPTKSQLCGR